VGFSQVAEALGDGAALDSVTPETLLAVAFSAGDASQLLKITPMEFVSEWESAIDDRAGLEDVGNAADTAYINASAAANTAAQRRAIDVIVAKDGKLMLTPRFNERLPGAAGGTVDCTAFPRLSKPAPGAVGQVPEARIRALASQLQVELPETADLSEGARAKWIWGPFPTLAVAYGPCGRLAWADRTRRGLASGARRLASRRSLHVGMDDDEAS